MDLFKNDRYIEHMSRIPKLFLYFGFITVASALAAHPHLWIDYKVSADVSDGILESFRTTWIFDDFFSSSLILDMDWNGDRKFQPKEVREIRDNAFSHLIEQEYFAILSINEEEFPITEAFDFTAVIEDGAVHYVFSIPVGEPIEIIDELNLGFFDLNYYISFAPISNQFSSSYVSTRFLEEIVKQPIDTLGWGGIDLPLLQMRRR